MQIRPERYSDCIDDIMRLAPSHWTEVEWEPEKLPLRINHEFFENADRQGALLTLTAREESKLVGYVMWIMSVNPKHAGAVVASNEVLYVDPEHRGHLLGPRLLRESEALIRRAGVKVMGICVKSKADFGPMLERGGYQPVETTWLKWIGD